MDIFATLSLFQSILCYLESDVCLRMKLGWRNLQVGFFVHKVDADQLLTFITLVTWQALTDRLICSGDALGSILTLVIITGTGARQDHWRWKLTEKATGYKQRHNYVTKAVLQARSQACDVFGDAHKLVLTYTLQGRCMCSHSPHQYSGLHFYTYCLGSHRSQHHSVLLRSQGYNRIYRMGGGKHIGQCRA